MGIFSKIAKGFKKIVKKVGRGIKKVAKKVGKVLGKIAKPFQKLGIIGNIALGFVMPWAIGGIFKGLGSLAGSAFGNFATGLTQSSNLFAKAAGYVFKGVHYGASKIQNAYSSITSSISEGMSWVGDKFKAAKEYVGDKFEAFGDWVKGSVEADPVNIQAQMEEDLFAEDLFKDPGSYGLSAEDSVTKLKEKIVSETGKGAFEQTATKFFEKGSEAFAAVPETLTAEAAKQDQGQTIIVEGGSGKNYGGFIGSTQIETYGDLPLQNQGFHYAGPASSSFVENALFANQPFFQDPFAAQGQITGVSPQ